MIGEMMGEGKTALAEIVGDLCAQAELAQSKDRDKLADKLWTLAERIEKAIPADAPARIAALEAELARAGAEQDELRDRLGTIKRSLHVHLPEIDPDCTDYELILGVLAVRDSRRKCEADLAAARAQVGDLLDALNEIKDKDRVMLDGTVLESPQGRIASDALAAARAFGEIHSMCGEIAAEKSEKGDADADASNDQLCAEDEEGVGLAETETGGGG